MSTTTIGETIRPATPEAVAWLNRTPEEVAREEIADRIRVTPEGCWLWLRYTDRDGYGRWGRAYAHRRVWKSLVGPIPPRHHLHHACASPSCVNPAHLSVMSPEDHARLPRRRPRMCHKGHEYTPATTSVAPDGSRICLICKPRRPSQPRATETHCAAGHLKTPETWREYRYDYGDRTVCLVCLRERYAASKGTPNVNH